MLTVYKASAGSGKTFQLVAEYLKLLIENPANYKNILAVTFTNKATTEMKSRILQQLNIISGTANSPYVDILKKELSLDEARVRKGAKLALKNILHDYSRFSVSTIDSFTQRIIKAFNREMGISPHFVLELDNELILEEAVDRLLSKVDKDTQLRKWLVEFSREKIMDNKSHHIESNIKELGQELFKEKFQVFFPGTDDSVYTRENIDDFKKELEKIIAVFKSTLHTKATTCISHFENDGFSVDDFLNKNAGVAGYLKKLADKDVGEPGVRVLKACESTEAWVTKKHPEKDRLIQLVDSRLRPLLIDILNFYTNNKKNYRTAEEVVKHLRILGILTDLKEEIKLLLHEKGILQLSDSNLLLSRIIGESDSPFIYEKIGNRYDSYMLDEFQDTSLLQWSNFKPLISNALSEGNQVLLVGDVKQSIYRWRNSDWNILATQINTDFPLYPPKPVSLTKNWRSRKNIIDFNNSMFKALIDTFEEGLFDEFDNDIYRKKFLNVYEEFYQEPGQQFSEADGKVEISFLDKDDTGQNSALLLVEKVKYLQDEGLRASEIAILIRKKDEGAVIVETFMDEARKVENAGYNLSLLSNESLFLYASRGVNFVILILELLTNPDEEIPKTALLQLWFTWLQPFLDNKDLSGSLQKDSGDWKLDGDADKVFDSILTEKIIPVREQVSLSSLDETIMKICEVFELFSITSELPYLQALIDKAAELKISLSNDLSNFLFWWKTKGYKISVNINEEVDSVRLLTIHKSKGLEYEAVLLPFFNFNSTWEGNQTPLLWCTPSTEPFSRFPLLPVKATKNLAVTIFKNDYFEEKVSYLIDTLNMIYVAFTRAKSALFIHCTEPPENKKNEQRSDVNALLQTALAKLGALSEFSSCYDQKNRVFTFGKLPIFLPVQNPVANSFLSTYHYRDFSDRISLRLKSEEFLLPDGQNRSVKNAGKMVHEMLASVNVWTDIKKACTRMVDEGVLSPEEGRDVLEKLEQGMQHPEVKRWFDGSYKVLNERNLLTPEKVLRPDRIMVSGNHAVVTDYKWGIMKQDKYNAQVGRYAKVLKSSGFRLVEGYIWYINLGEIVKVGRWE